MKVFATTAMQEAGVSTYQPLFGRMAAQDRFGVHGLAGDAEEADFILFLDGHQHYRDMELKAIRRHPLVLKYREKAFVYSEMDQPWCAMPGLYVSMPKTSFDARRQRACSYLALPNSDITPSPEPGEKEALLFSFMGRGGNRTRERILGLKHPRAHIADTSNTDFFGSRSEAHAQQQRAFAEVIARSKFVICPRGAGPSSFRIFETMAAGRVPVIVSDLWVAPAGPAWENCALFVKERDIEGIGAILEKYEASFSRMARAARCEWEQWFAPDVLFHRMTEGLKDIVEKRTAPESVLCREVSGRYLRLRARAVKAKLKEMLRAPRRSFELKAADDVDLVDGVDTN